MSVRTNTIVKFIINLIFALYNCVLGIASFSWWFLSVGVYYIIFSFMRLSVVIFTSENRRNIKFIMRFCGAMIIFLSVVFCGTVYMTTENIYQVKYHEIAMISIALYTFIKLAVAIYKILNNKYQKSYAMRTLRNITFADAVVSMYSLQRAMLVSFDGMSYANINILNLLSGITVCIVVLIIGLNLIIERKMNMEKSKIAAVNEKIASGVKSGYKKIENAVVDGYKMVEKGAVKGYTKIEDKFVDKYLTKDGETVEEAKIRLSGKKDTN